ncbi:hypothetical protein [Actinophytocola sp. NPDC049390]|uniref:hypothetical protein n=1 Tax=Actinophytocola sp. NPDC049390 TaxID=3363894 RepID=UPI00379E6803
MSTLEEMGHVMRTAPGPAAGTREVADWYRRKALLLDHLANGGPATEATHMHALADVARQHAADLLSLSRNDLAPASWAVGRRTVQNSVGGLAASNGS